jgi:hypothetical protein
MDEDYDIAFPVDELDRWMQRQKPPAPSAALMNHCLATIPQVGSARVVRPYATWQYAVTVAAAVLLWINLSMSAVQSTDFGYQRGTPNVFDRSNEKTVQEIRELTPQFLPEVAR